MAVKDRLEAAFGVRVIAVGPMPVGFGLAGYRCDLADGRRLAVKARAAGGRADLMLEAYMLGELARHSALPVPAVHVRLFGGAYIPPIEQTLSRVGL